MKWRIKSLSIVSTLGILGILLLASCGGGGGSGGGNPAADPAPDPLPVSRWGEFKYGEGAWTAKP